MSARRTVAKLARDGVRLWTKGENALVPSRDLSPALVAAIREHFGAVHELVSAREDDEADRLIARAGNIHGWGHDDVDAARRWVESDARPALAALRWAAESGDVRDMLRKQPAARPARVRASRQRTRKATSP